MRTRGHVAACTAVLMLGAVSLASADILEAHFSGTTGGNAGSYGSGGSLGCPIPLGLGRCSFFNAPFTATFLFNTDLGALFSPSPGTYELYGPYDHSGSFGSPPGLPVPQPTTSPLITASLTVDGVGTFTNSGVVLNFLIWQTDGLGEISHVQTRVMRGSW
jgi:hypothetical protein